MPIQLLRYEADRKTKITLLKAEAAQIGDRESIDAEIKRINQDLLASKRKKMTDTVSVSKLGEQTDAVSVSKLEKKTDAVRVSKLEEQMEILERKLADIDTINKAIEQTEDALTYAEYTSASPKEREKIKEFAETIILSENFYEKWQLISLNTAILYQLDLLPSGGLSNHNALTNKFEKFAPVIESILSKSFFRDFTATTNLEIEIQKLKDKIEALEESDQGTLRETRKLDSLLTEVSSYLLNPTEIVQRAKLREDEIVESFSKMKINESLDHVQGEDHSVFEKMFRQGSLPKSINVQALDRFKQAFEKKFPNPSDVTLRNEILEYFSENEKKFEQKGLVRAAIVLRELKKCIIEADITNVEECDSGLSKEMEVSFVVRKAKKPATQADLTDIDKSDRVLKSTKDSVSANKSGMSEEDLELEATRKANDYGIKARMISPPTAQTTSSLSPIIPVAETKTPKPTAQPEQPQMSIIKTVRRALSWIAALGRKKNPEPRRNAVVSHTLHIHEDLVAGKAHAAKVAKDKLEKSLKGSVAHTKAEPVAVSHSASPTVKQHIVFLHSRKVKAADLHEGEGEGEGEGKSAKRNIALT